MKFFLKYIKAFFKPKFQPSEQDLLILEGKENEVKGALQKIENSKLNTYDLNVNLLVNIYEEVDIIREKIYGTDNYYLKKIDYKNSIVYYDLLSSDSKTRIQFLYFILKLVNNSFNKKVTHFHKEFLSNLFNSILQTEIEFQDEDFLNFLNFKNRNRIPFEISKKLLFKIIITYSFKNTLSEEFLKLIRKRFVLEVNLSAYDYNYTEPVYRVLTNAKYFNRKIPFFLLPDYFGNKVNGLFFKMDEDNAIVFSEVLQLSSLNLKKDSFYPKVQKLINDIGTLFFIETCIKVLEFVGRFKPKVRITCSLYHNEENYICSKFYAGMFQENFTIVYGLLKTLERETIVQNIPPSILVKIAKRSYSLKENERLRKGATKLGDLCLKLMAYNYGSRSEKILKKFYTEITYKRVRKKIDFFLNEINNE